MNLIDRTREAMGWNNPWQTRKQNKIKRIVVHHSATAAGNMRIFENHWRTKGWRNGGYAEIILPNGDVEICYPPTVVTNGAGVWNKTSYHICVVGNFRKNGAQPSSAQMQSLLTRIRHNMNVFNVPVKKIKGHKELMPTICPGMNMPTLRNQVQREAAPTNNANPTTHTIRQGDTFWSLSRIWQVTVEEIKQANPSVNPANLRIGQRINRPARNSQPAATQTNAIRVGSSVRVNNTAQSWATGQVIPTWVRGRTYTVQQMRNNNTELLLADIVSWIRRSDVTKV
ncbi:MAG: N-acetylmuramoyl-L-alanine amidase [Turicibacter sp.]|nr:N-acetylmuramoyl-L-alanine amidase [Turicibacter sp.]